jgi:AraC-like DNA-binding protein
VKIDPAREWRVPVLAAMAHMSVTHFKRTVREVYGVTPGEMLAGIRLEKALTLMRATDLTLDSVAELSGYSTSFALSKACRRVHGESPRRWAQGGGE